MNITLSAPAKINLFLDVTGRRPDGYHTITGVMQAVSLCDTVTVEVTEPTGMYVCSLGAHTAGAASITLTCTNPDRPTDSRNLAWRAAEKFFAATGRGCKKLAIHIEKNIPAAAGMAGGSTDAAAVLVALNQLFDLPLTTEALCEAGLTLGADIPFCIKGKAHITEGVGEILTPITPMPECELVVACGGEGVSTPAAYKALDTLYGNFDPAVYTPCAKKLNTLKTALCVEGNIAYAKPQFAAWSTLDAEEYTDAQVIAMIEGRVTMETSFGTIVEKISELVNSFWVYIVLAMGATVVVWGTYLGIRVAVAKRKEEQINARGMIKNLVVGIIVMFTIAMAVPLLINGLSWWVTW